MSWKAARKNLPCDDGADEATQNVRLMLWRSGTWKHLPSAEAHCRRAGYNEAITLARRGEGFVVAITEDPG